MADPITNLLTILGQNSSDESYSNQIFNMLGVTDPEAKSMIKNVLGAMAVAGISYEFALPYINDANQALSTQNNQINNMVSTVNELNPNTPQGQQYWNQKIAEGKQNVQQQYQTAQQQAQSDLSSRGLGNRMPGQTEALNQAAANAALTSTQNVQLSELPTSLQAQESIQPLLNTATQNAQNYAMQQEQIPIGAAQAIMQNMDTSPMDEYYKQLLAAEQANNWGFQTPTGTGGVTAGVGGTVNIPLGNVGSSTGTGQTTNTTNPIAQGWSDMDPQANNLPIATNPPDTNQLPLTGGDQNFSQAPTNYSDQNDLVPDIDNTGSNIGLGADPLTGQPYNFDVTNPATTDTGSSGTYDWSQSWDPTADSRVAGKTQSTLASKTNIPVAGIGSY